MPHPIHHTSHFLFIYSSIIHLSPAPLTPPPPLQYLHSAILWQATHHGEPVWAGMDYTAGWAVQPVAALHTQSAAQTLLKHQR